MRTLPSSSHLQANKACTVEIGKTLESIARLVHCKKCFSCLLMPYQWCRSHWLHCFEIQGPCQKLSVGDDTPTRAAAAAAIMYLAMFWSSEEPGWVELPPFGTTLSSISMTLMGSPPATVCRVWALSACFKIAMLPLQRVCNCNWSPIAFHMVRNLPVLGHGPFMRLRRYNWGTSSSCHA